MRLRISWCVEFVTKRGVQLPFLAHWFRLEPVVLRQKSCLFRTCPNHVHTYIIRHPTAEFAKQKPDGNLTRVSSPCDSLACETILTECENWPSSQRLLFAVLELGLFFTVAISSWMHHLTYIVSMSLAYDYKKNSFVYFVENMTAYHPSGCIHGHCHVTV